MKRILLLRHAKSSWDDPALSDRDRPLAPRGLRAAELIAEHLRGNGLEVELVLCSSARRARETLERLGTSLGSARTSIEDDLYGASDDELLERLRRLPEGVASVAMIGHNPGLHDLAVALTQEGRKLERFPTGALATLDFDGLWADLGSRRARLAGFVKPKDLT
ncbi:MAG TPA: histidine phosphatase family protein [Actinomycetota bacterium]|jgi:phosphohistidine phosphatase|nr:histidine phosphatase family protein [Actinomycetota bacterium]